MMRKLFFIGVICGMLAAVIIGPVAMKLSRKLNLDISLPSPLAFLPSFKSHKVVEKFTEPMPAISGKTFGKNGQLTFELFRGGTFVLDGKSGYAWQKSASYRDSAFIRSTNALPKTYKVSAVVGGIDYGLEKIQRLKPDSEYAEGPLNENGCYLLVITDEKPENHHTNAWWHQHRKVAIDVDNNIWGSGMPNPVFMVYFDRQNQLNAFNGKRWVKEWDKARSYDPKTWYRVEVEKTVEKFILSVYTEQEKLLSRTSVPLKKIWHEDNWHPDYLVIGDPHENYYQGAMKIREITIEY